MDRYDLDKFRESFTNSINSGELKLPTKTAKSLYDLMDTCGAALRDIDIIRDCDICKHNYVGDEGICEECVMPIFSYHCRYEWGWD